MLQIRFSNRFERLLDALLDAMAAPPASAFVREEIIVPSAAVRRRVELAAADRFGICANVEFSFLAQWLWRQIGHVVPIAETSPFTASVLTWRVLGIFAEPGFVAEHPPLARYLHDADDVMRYELAARAAALLEQYLTYRPDWLSSWLSGKPASTDGLDPARQEDERWQGALWQRIARDLGADRRHPSVAFFEAMRAMGPDAPARLGLPATAHVFCLPTTPPLYLDILRGLGRWIDLRLYVPNPCREYWYEIVDARRLSYLAARGEDTHHETGNRLLAAWGRQTQAHIDLLLADDTAVVDDADFVPSGEATLLARLQDAILDLTDLDRGSVPRAAGDRSVEVHVCHSLTRELEVLQDQLLALFAGRDPPRPSDILVVTPDLVAAAPLIDAVFGNAPKARAIPYTITGRPASALDPCAQALSTILAVAMSRFPASAVFELLQQPIVARRFAIDTADLGAIHEWIREAGIRWGIDGEHRRRMGLPGTDRHSFGDGLDRLFLGYALPAAVSVPINGRLAAGNAEGRAALALGSFRAFVRRLERLHDDLAQSRTPAGWRQVLLDVLDDFLAPVGDEIDDARATATAVQELHADMVRGGIDRPLTADVVRAALQARLDDPTRGGIPGGAVTFAAMASLRHLPYRFVCAVGLADGAFPSTQRPPEFDLIARAPRRGDRQRRIDERNVFLDLVLAARERLYLSYTGRSIRDNAPLPPSVLVAELVDYLVAATAEPPHTPATLDAARRKLVVVHPLQPFSQDYFVPDADPRARSFDDGYCAALKQRLAVPATPASAATETPAGTGDAAADDRAWEPQRRFFDHPLAAAGPEFRELALEDLVRFYGNPARYLLRKRLGIVLPRGDEELADDEPFAVDRNARVALAQRVLPQLLRGTPASELREFAGAGTEYPTGRLGGIQLDEELLQLEVFAHELAPALAAPPLDAVQSTLDVEIDGEPWRVTGSFGDLRPGGLVRYRYDDVRPRDYLEGWILHVFLNALAPAGATAQSSWHSRDGRFRLPPIGDARAQLAKLVRLYRDGLARPLRFFPKTAWAYVASGESLSRARALWESSRFSAYGEDREPAIALALRGVDDPLDAEFVECAKTVFGPLREIIVDPRLKAR